MFYLEGNRIITSDWHLLHKNIWIYEFNKRKQFLPIFFDSEDKLIDYYKTLSDKTLLDFYLEAEYNILSTIYIKLNNLLIKNPNINEYYDLGDFLCFPNITKIAVYKKTKNFILLTKIFNLLKKNNIKTILFLGNHDDKKVINFYTLFFSEIKVSEFKYGILYSHEPFNKNGKNFGINTKDIKINYHGHVHSNIANEISIHKDIHYINVCLDNLL